jgi:hypothetical protein
MALDVIQVQLGDQGQAEAELLAFGCQVAEVRPGDGHALVRHVAEPAAEDRHPVPEPHQFSFF